MTDPFSPVTRKVADSYWRACLGDAPSFSVDMKALGAAIRTLATELSYELESDLVIDIYDLYNIADELEKSRD